MQDEFTRAELVLGKEAIEKLKASRVVVFGVGGVGSHAAEAIARSGVGAIDLVDDDIVNLTNINRQLVALHSTIGRKKAEVMRDRILDINPKCTVKAIECFYTAQNADEIDIFAYDYVVDAIDTISSKLLLIERAKAAGVPIISCMGAGNKIDPTGFMVADIYKTSVCPLARVMRRELKARGIASLKVVYSKEEPIKPDEGEEISRKNTDGKSAIKRQVPGSVSFVPPVAGFILASEVIKDLIGNIKTERIAEK
jgi:tRNA A37 threonylcarbamoyladenosine dehydratase